MRTRYAAAYVIIIKITAVPLCAHYVRIDLNFKTRIVVRRAYRCRCQDRSYTYVIKGRGASYTSSSEYNSATERRAHTKRTHARTRRKRARATGSIASHTHTHTLAHAVHEQRATLYAHYDLRASDAVFRTAFENCHQILRVIHSSGNVFYVFEIPIWSIVCTGRYTYQP